MHPSFAEVEVGFGLFRIIFTLRKLQQKELALKSRRKFCSLSVTAHVMSYSHGCANIEVSFMMAQ